MTRLWRPAAVPAVLRSLVPVWSAPACLRALRATIVIPSLFVLTFKVIGDPQMTLFAVFGGFGTLVLTSFGGTRQHQAVAHLGLAIAGSVTLGLGTLLSSPPWLAVVATLPIAFTVYTAGSAGPNAASAVNACLLAFVLPIASTGSASELPSRLAGWWLAAAASTAAVLLISARPPGDRLRAQAASLARALAAQLDAATHGTATQPGQERVRAAERELLNAFTTTPYRPIGLAAADLALANLIHLLEWCAALVSDTSDDHLDLRAGAEPDLALLALSARALGQVAALLAGDAVSPDRNQIWQARLASVERLQHLSADPPTAVREADFAFHAETIGLTAAAALDAAMIATGAATPAVITRKRQSQVAGQLASRADRGGGPPSWLGNPVQSAARIQTNASLRSVWFRNGARGAIALAAAVGVAKLSDVQHAFWVVLGTLSVLRTSATATGATAMRALAGTVMGFIVGGAVLVAIGTDPTALWIIFPVVVAVAAYTPGTAPFAVGQAAFTMVIVILYNLLVPVGWKVGLLRVEDVAIGCAVSLVVGLLFWPRGVSAVLGDNLADAFRSGAAYLRDAAGWALGDRQLPPERAVAAIAARDRLDDAVRGYLTEQGSKRVAKGDLWKLLMASTRLRLTAASMATTPARTGSQHDHTGLHAALERQAAGLSQFYGQVADLVGRPTRSGPRQARGELPPSGMAALSRSPGSSEVEHRCDALWVGHHLDHLEAHALDITGPAGRLAAVRRRPWWR